MKQAFKYFLLGAQQGDADAENSVGICFEQGLGVEPSFQQARHYFKYSADQGNQYGIQNYKRITNQK